MSNTVKCYECKHRRSIPGDVHIMCVKPDPTMTGNSRAIVKGWFDYPYNFDPIWMTKICSNFEQEI